MDNSFGQEDIELTIEALRHWIESLDIQTNQFKLESAQICSKMMETMDKYHAAVNDLLDSIISSMGDDDQAFDNIKLKFNKLYSIQRDFYDREEKKCTYNTPNTFMIEEDKDDKDNIILCEDMCDILDARIKEYEHIIVHQRQQEQLEQQRLS